MNNLKKLKEDRSDLVGDLEALTTVAASRHLSDTEKEKISSIEKKIRVLDVDISSLEQAEENKAKKSMNNNLNNPYDNANVSTTLDDYDETGRGYLDKAKKISLIDSKTRLKNSKVKEELSLGELIVAKIRGPQNSVEKAALDTSLDASGGITTRVSSAFWDRARSMSTVVRAGASTLNMESGEHGNVVIPQITGSITPEWKVENVNVTLSDPTFTAREFDFKTIMAGTKVSNELVQDSGSLLAQMIEYDLAKTFGSEIDRVALLGSGAGEEPLGLSLTPGINVFAMGTNGGDLQDFNPLVGSVRMLLDDDIPLDKIGGYIMNPREWEAFALFKSAGELQQLVPPTQIANLPFYVTSKIATDLTVGSSTDTSVIFVGDWSQLVIGIRLGLKIRFFEQTFAQSYSTLIAAVARLDIQLINPEAFCKISGITPGPAIT